ncbi:hypothetical protein [Tissierella pigra]|uniref:Uncharacterized protein n=1 Tax=Tissierella pigra TaxID=2607614 RepID=A0A6N7XH62_9FIRM|nr:hypothetical protein [Tissierella pigra]MSU01381.1 hypothetical protein [Tissierella pigra]
MARKNNFVELVKLDQTNLEENFKVVNVTDDNITRASSYDFLTKALEVYKGRKFENNERVTEYIKVNLSKDEEIARQQWFDGIEYEGHNYKAWFATVGGMKKDESGICDTIFIREDYQDFADKVEDLVSLGKFKELEGKEICINKDVLSRLSLITSDLIGEIDLPNFIVLPTATLDYIEDYKTVKPIRYKEINDEGVEVDKVDYELVDYHFDTNKRDKNGDPIDEIECFDGGGIATPEVFESIRKSMGVDYPIEFSIIRGYGMATKGLITKFDIIGYLDSQYKGDTPYLRRVNGQYELLDRWGDFRPVTANTMLLNDSMVKLAKYFDSMEEYLERVNSVEDKYKNLLNKLYITKINKKDNQLSDYRRTNYQLINALALTPQEYKVLAEQDYQMLKKIIRPFDKAVSKTSNNEFVINTDYIKLFFKNIVDEDISEEDVDYQEKLHKALDGSIVDKVNELISLDEDFVRLDMVKRSLGSLVEKKVRQLASGKVTVKGKYQYMACCPISYINFAMYRNQGNDGLAKDQFYSADCEDGDIRTISRNPLSAYSEVHNVEFTRNNFFDKWLSHCRELIYFNQKSDMQNLLSSADFDGDGLLQIDNDIIRNAVVTPRDGKYFITLSDRKQKKLHYNAENRFISTYEASGNLIGKIALKAANVNSNCQNVPDLYDNINKKFLNWNELWAEFEAEGKTQEELSDYIKAKLKDEEFSYGVKMGQELKDRMIEKFYEYEKEIYIILYNSMKAIDATKTLVFPDKADMEIIDSKYFKKVDFLRYKEAKEDVINKDYIYTYSLLDRFAKRVQDDLLNTIESRASSFRDRADVIQGKFINDEYSKEIYNLCNTEIQRLYKKYTDERSAIYNSYSSKKKALDSEKYFRQNSGNWYWYDDDWYMGVIADAKEERNKGYKELDKKYIPLADEIIKQFDLATICQCIADMKNCTENFIISLFWKCFEFINTDDKVRIIYKKDDAGDILFLHERYKAIAVKGFDNSNVVDRIAKDDLIKRNMEKRIRFRMSDKSIIREIEEDLKLGRVYELNLNDVRVKVFDDFADLTKGQKILKITSFEKRKDGRYSITDKSFGAYIQA